MRIGPWRVDFWFPAQRVAVEPDGGRFHSTAAKRDRDARKTAALTQAGATLVRLSWAQITHAPAATAAHVHAALTDAARR